MAKDLKFAYEDNGNCRVYYNKGRDYYCFQWEGSAGWKFYVCTRDGEPSYEVPRPERVPLPPGEDAIGQQLRGWLTMEKTS